MKEPTAAALGFIAALSIPALALGLFTPITDGMYQWKTAILLFPVGYGYSALLSLPIAIPAYLLCQAPQANSLVVSTPGGLCDRGSCVDIVEPALHRTVELS